MFISSYINNFSIKPPVGFEPATPVCWGFGTPAQWDALRKLRKTPLKHVCLNFTFINAFTMYTLNSIAHYNIPPTQAPSMTPYTSHIHAPNSMQDRQQSINQKLQIKGNFWPWNGFVYGDFTFADFAPINMTYLLSGSNLGIPKYLLFCYPNIDRYLKLWSF